MATVSPKPVPATTVVGRLGRHHQLGGRGSDVHGPGRRRCQSAAGHLERVANAGPVEHQAGECCDAPCRHDCGRAPQCTPAGVGRQRDGHAAAITRRQVAEGVLSRDDQPEISCPPPRFPAVAL